MIFKYLWMPVLYMIRSQKNILKNILSWYAAHKRDLPWRATEDPYHIVVSEFMLQQTQVPRVILKYEEFLKRFPTITALAKASPAAVIDAWAGLGYNRRAVHLHQFATAVVNTYAGKIPEERRTLMELPGIGPYTSHAILCFAFKKDVPVIDINIKRIFSRLFFKGAGTEEELEEKAQELLPRGKGVAWNNALMDFGSLVCTDKPRCSICPLRKSCSAFRAGTPEKYVKPKQQSRFKESDRYYRSLVIKELRKRGCFSAPKKDIEAVLPKSKGKKWKEKILLSLERDGLVVRKKENVSLPTAPLLP